MILSQNYRIGRWTIWWIRSGLDSCPQSCGQWLNVQEKTNDKWSLLVLQGAALRRSLVVLVDEKLSMTQQCVYSPKSEPYPGLYQKREQQVEGGDFSSLLCSCETSTCITAFSSGAPSMRWM